MRFTVTLLLLVCAILVGGTWVMGQVVQPQPVTPTVLSGADIGFRMVGRKGATPTGRLVVRIDGQWVEAELSSGLKLITK